MQRCAERRGICACSLPSLITGVLHSSYPSSSPPSSTRRRVAFYSSSNLTKRTLTIVSLGPVEGSGVPLWGTKRKFYEMYIAQREDTSLCRRYLQSKIFALSSKKTGETGQMTGTDLGASTRRPAHLVIIHAIFIRQ